MNQQLKRALVCAFLSFSAVCIAQSASDWPMYGHDGGSSRFSPLADINAQNVATLERAWTFHMAPTTPATPATGLAARLRQRRSETTPLMVDGVLYLPTPYNQVIALDASSGKN